LYTKNDVAKCAHGVGFKINGANTDNPALYLHRYNQGLLDGRSKFMTATMVPEHEYYFLAGNNVTE
jgi:hypothetical protein